MNAASHPNRDSNALAQLDAEWNVIVDRAIAKSFARWQQEHSLLRRFSGPRHLIDSLHAAAVPDTDEPLLILLELASRDRLAGRVVLQAFLPALKALSQRIVYPVERSDEVWELLFFHAWKTIRTYPTHKRRRSVAANLKFTVLRGTLRELHHPDDPTLPDRPQTAVLTTDAQELVLAAADSGLITHKDAELILRTRFHHEQLVQIADEHTASYTALRMRRIRAEQRLRDHLIATGVVTFSAVFGPTSIEGQVRERPIPPSTIAAFLAVRRAAA